MKSIPLGWRTALITYSLLVLGCDGSDKNLVGTGDSIRPEAVAAVPQLAFTAQPVTTTAGVLIPSIQVTAQDAQGNTVTTFTGNITVAFGANPAGGVLGGDKTKRAVSGVATFPNLSIKKAGTGYTLVASAPPAAGFASGTSAAFDITPAPASKLAFTVQPTSLAAGDTMAPAVEVSALDAYDNTATTFVGNVSVALRSCPAGAVLFGTLLAPAVNGVAVFADLSVNKSGNCGLTATSGSLTKNSATFVVGPAAPAFLIFQTQPSQTKAGVVIAPAVKVTARDRFGNTASGFNGAVTMTIGSGPAGALLYGTTTVTAVSGTASFATLSIQKVGQYTLRASADSLVDTTSNGFTIKPNSPTHLAFTVQPSNAAPGALIMPPIEVTVRDAYDNTVPINGSVTLAIGSNPGGGTLSGTKTRSASTGVATFANLSIDNAGTGYTLVATLGNLPSTISAPFNIGSGNPPTQLAFTVQPSNATSAAAIAPPVQVTAKDALGNAVSSFTGNVTVSIGTNPNAGTLSGTLTVAAVSGVATFSDLSINNAGSGYTLQASSGGLTTATSIWFDITPGPATQIAIEAGDGQSANVSSTVPIAPAVLVRDQYGNPVSSVGVVFAVASGGGSVTGENASTNSNGIATVGSWTLGSAPGTNTLTATAAGSGIAGNPVTFTATAVAPSNTWSANASMPTARFALAAAAIDGTLYAVGGNARDALEAYDPATDAWTTKPSMPAGPRGGLGAVAINGILYAVGGRSGNVNVATLEAYDPLTNTWAMKAPMPTPRTSLGVAVINGILYAVGGSDNGGNRLATVEAYDPVTDMWTTKAPMPTARADLSAAALGGILYAIGGVTSTSNNATTVEAYDPVSDAWTTKASMLSGRGIPGVAALSGALYVVGGLNESSGLAGLATVEAYDPVSDMWTPRTSMPTARWGLGAAALNGRLYAVGGYSNGVLATLEAYQP